jgi:hypothetical protein
LERPTVGNWRLVERPPQMLKTSSPINTVAESLLRVRFKSLRE